MNLFATITTFIIELESLTDMSQHSPAMPGDHSFKDVQEFYWSSTTSMYDISYEWVLYMLDGAVGVGHKPLSEFYLWPVRGKESIFVHQVHVKNGGSDGDTA